MILKKFVNILIYFFRILEFTNFFFKNFHIFLRISTFDEFQPYVTPSGIRSIIGKRLANIFGIWSKDEPDGSNEFFGYSLYPSASFFNHSCRPNLIDIGIGPTITLKLVKDVKKDEELLISYLYSSNDDFEIRQKNLKEWFFDCLCQRCVEEKNLKSAKK
jgi:SET and MYND domain-containing protein